MSYEPVGCTGGLSQNGPGRWKCHRRSRGIRRRLDAEHDYLSKAIRVTRCRLRARGSRYCLNCVTNLHRSCCARP